MPGEETSAAIARVLSSLAKRDILPNEPLANGLKAKISLPGEDTAERQMLERELNALQARICFLEHKALSDTGSLPITPNEPSPGAFGPGNINALPRVPHHPVQQRQRSATWVNSLLGRSEGATASRQLTEEQLGVLREHIDHQATEIERQKEFIAEIKTELSAQQTATKYALDTLGSSPSIEQLKREVEKNAQINDTYKKVLKEIGTIITAVANGDLSKKVRIHTPEKDPEIAKFKSTINTMVDQLQQFAKQVTHLAKEVGTEGQLGGQAQVPGVDGIWAELTENGTSGASLSQLSLC